MIIEGYGYHIGLRAPIAYIRDAEGVCPVLVADLEAVAKANGPVLTHGAALKHVPNRLERNMTDAPDSSTRPADGTPCREDPQAEPAQGIVLPGELPPSPPARGTERGCGRLRGVFRGWQPEAGRRGGRGHQAVAPGSARVMIAAADEESS